MCIKHIDYFDVCGHNGKNDADVAAFAEIEQCPGWDGESCKALRTREVRHAGKCPKCAGNEDMLWYKHCYQSEICDHEYGHALTDLERYRNEEDVVLVTPTYGLCPDCQEAGFDQRPGATKTASAMPKEFENLTRRPIEDVPRVSAMPAEEFEKAVTSKRPDGSSLPSSTYNPAASRVPPSKAPSSTSRPSQAPKYTSQAPTQSRVPSHSQYPANSQAPTTVRMQSNYPFESRRPSQYPASASASTKPATQIYNPVSAVPDATASKKPAMSPADYLKRGAPKNVSPSAFYSNADGDEARARIGSPSAAPAQSTRPSSAPKSSAPRSYERTQAPPADAESPDLEELMSGVSVAPSYYPQPSRTPGGHAAFPQGSKVPGASAVPRSEAPRHSQMPSTSASRAPAPSSVPRPEAPRHSQVPSQSRAPPPSSIPRSEAPHHSQVPSTSRPSPSRTPEHSSTSRPTLSSYPQQGQTALPNYKTIASPQSAFPSKAPPGYSGAQSGSSAPRSSVPKSSVPKSTTPRAGGRNGDGRHAISAVPEENEEGGSR